MKIRTPFLLNFPGAILSTPRELEASCKAPERGFLSSAREDADGFDAAVAAAAEATFKSVGRFVGEVT